MRALLLSLLVIAACGQRDKGFVDGGPDPTSCDAKVCNDPPPSACVDAHTLGSFEPTGTCDRGQCAYREELIGCAMGCDHGACVGEPCAGVHCDHPPASSCVDGGTLRSYDATGTCDAGVCSYTAHDTACGAGCANAACTGDPCAGVTCDTPPASTCVDADDLRTYGAGTCAGGTCSYPSSTTTCGFGCAAGACAGDPCAGVTCNKPPAAYCVDPVTLKSFAAAGACAGGGCTYAVTETVCTFGCSGGACAGDPCVGVTCDSPPANTCVNGALRVWSATGTCGGGACAYGYVDEPCPNGCSGNACVGVSCGAGTCDKPPANTCKDVSHATIYAPLGTCATSTCAYQANDLYCSKGCLNGACLPGSWTYEYNPLTDGHLVSDDTGSLAVDAAGLPHEAVCNYDALVYNEYTLYGWKQTVIAPGVENECTKAMVVAPNGAVYIAYGDPANHLLRFAERAPGAATFAQSLVTLDTNTDLAVGMTLDGAGNPVVGYRDLTRGQIRIATRKNGVWSYENAFATTLGAGDTIVVRFAANGDLHVLSGYGAVSSQTSTLWPIGHGVKSGGVWTGTTLSGAGAIGRRSMGIAPSGAPYFLFATMPTQFTLDLQVLLPGGGLVQALKNAPIDRASVPVTAYDWFGGDLKVARVGGTINGPQTIGYGAKQNGAWADYLPTIDYPIADGEVGPDGRTRFLAVNGWTLVTAPVCQPACAARTCGSDGCGGTCGSCPMGKSCSAAGACM